MHRLKAVTNIRQGTTKQHRHSISHVSFRRLSVKLRHHNPSITPVTVNRRHASISVLLRLVASYCCLDCRRGTPRHTSGWGGEEPELRGSAAKPWEARGGSEWRESEHSESGRECHGGVAERGVGVLEGRGFHRFAAIRDCASWEGFMILFLGDFWYFFGGTLKPFLCVSVCSCAPSCGFVLDDKKKCLYIYSCERAWRTIFLCLVFFKILIYWIIILEEWSKDKTYIPLFMSCVCCSLMTVKHVAHFIKINWRR